MKPATTSLDGPWPPPDLPDVLRAAVIPEVYAAGAGETVGASTGVEDASFVTVCVCITGVGTADADATGGSIAAGVAVWAGVSAESS